MEEKEDNIYIKSSISEIYAMTEVTQFFTNPLDNAIELSICIPIKKQTNLLKFVVYIGEKIVLSVVMPKEESKEKYNDLISSGNMGFIMEYIEDMNFYLINLGNINPKQKIRLNSIFIQPIGIYDLSYQFEIMEKYPSFHYKQLKNDESKYKTINANFKIETNSKITRLIAPFLEEKNKKINYQVIFNNNYKKAEIKYIKKPKEENKNNKYMKKFQNSDENEKGISDSYFYLLFRTEEMNKPILYYQYNPEFKETAYCINFIYPSDSIKKIPIPKVPDQDNKVSYSDKYENNIINDCPGLFIFLLDQSGSMEGKPIELMKKSLLIFIQSLPEGSYFQLIGFGTIFQKYNQEPVEYNKENVINIINVINNLRPNLGGTNIIRPLEEIYNDKKYSEINLNKIIFLLTDGKVSNRDICIDLIEKNSNLFRVHSFGLGKEFDKILIEKCGKFGKGSSSFVEEIENINSVVINALNKSLRPYFTDIHFNFKNYQNNINNCILTCNQINNFVYQNEIINFSFILDEKKRIDINILEKPINIEINAKSPKYSIKERISFLKNLNIKKFSDGDELSKMIIGKILKNNKENFDEKKEIEIAKKYQILSKNTSLFAELINDEINNYSTKLIKVVLIGNESNSRLKRIKEEKQQNYRGISIGNQNNINNNINKKPNLIKEKEIINQIQDNNTRLIMTQDIIEGFWDENEETRNLINIVSLVKFNKIKNKVKMLNKNGRELQLVYTILVIFFLLNKHSDKFNEYKLVINKGKKFLIKQGINYEKFISDI